MNIKFNKYKYIFLLCFELFEIVIFPLSASTIDTDELVRTISDSYKLPINIDNFEKLLDKLDDLRHRSEREKRTALDIYSDISDNHLYLESRSILHQNRFYRGFLKASRRLENDAFALNILTNFVRSGNADLTTQSCYYDTLYYHASNHHEAIRGWQEICDSEDATDSLKAGAHLKLADHFKSKKGVATKHFKKALRLSISDQSVLDLNYKAKALIGLAKLADIEEGKHTLFLDALATLNLIKHPKSFHNELLIHTYLGLAQNRGAPYRERIYNFHKALQIATEISDYYSTAQAHIGLGKMVDNDHQGREHYEEAIHCIGSHRNESDIYLLAEAHIGLGNIGDKQNFEEALSVLRPLGKDTYPYLWAQVYIGLGQNENATDNDKKLDFKYAIKIAKKHQEYNLVAKAYIGMGNARFGSKYFKKALHYLEKVGKHKHPRLWAQAYLGLANSLDRGENEDQVYYYKKARDIAYDNNFESILEKAYRGLGNLYLSQGDFIKSVDYFNETYTISGDHKIIERFSNKFYLIFKELMKIGFEYHSKKGTYPAWKLEQYLRKFLTRNLSGLNQNEKEFTDHFVLEGFKTLRICEQEAIRVFFPSLKELTDSYFSTRLSEIRSSNIDSSSTDDSGAINSISAESLSVISGIKTQGSSEESLLKLTSENGSETKPSDSVRIIESLSASTPSSTSDMKKRYFDYESDSSNSQERNEKWNRCE